LAVADDVHQFSPACDGILQADSVERLASYLDYSKNLMKVLRVGFIFSLLYNVVGLSFAVQGLLAPVIAAILMPLSSITVVGFGVLAGAWYSRRV
jgi:Cu+-exporting ATPase